MIVANRYIKATVLLVASLISHPTLWAQTRFGLGQGGEQQDVKYMTDALELLGDIPPAHFRFDHVLDYYFPIRGDTADFSRIDSILLMAERYRMTPIICLSYEPTLMGRRSQFEYSQTRVERYIKRCAILVEYLARIYPGIPKIYEIWNEPNEKWFWNGTAGQFVDLYRRTDQLIRSIDTTASVGGPALSGVQPHKLRWFRRFVQGLARNALRPDFISFHYYGDPGERFREGVREVRTIVRSILGYVPPFYLTEWNISWRPTAENAGVLEKRMSLIEDIEAEGILIATYFELKQVGQSRDGVGLVDRRNNISPFWPLFRERMTTW